MADATSVRDRDAPGLLARLGQLYSADDRALVATAGTVFALASAGAAMAASAADAMFLTALGPEHLGEAVALSSLLLAIVLAVVGGLVDRLERRRVLATLSITSAVVIAGLAALSFVAPAVAAGITFVGGKQLAAASDLAFWVVIAERLDARRSRRLLPVLAATGGAGAALGSALVTAIVSTVGAAGILACSAVLLALAGIGAARLAATRRVARPVAPLGMLIARSWRDGFRAVRRNPLARHLALLVALAGAFAMLAYFALGVSLVASGGSTTDIAALLGGIRGVGQAITLVVQLVVAPRLLARLGTGQTLLLAPALALAAGLGLVVAPILAVAIATQLSARVLDAGVETPAEKLAQTLLPSAIRGRVGGFLDGPAKRAGGMLGGLVAAALAGSPIVFYVITAVIAALWLLAAVRIARELPALAIEHVARDRESEAIADTVIDARALDVLRKELDGERPERAAEVLVRLHERGRGDAVPALVGALGRQPRARTLVWRSLVAVLDQPASTYGPAIVAAAKTCEPSDLELAIRAVGLAGGTPVAELEAWQASSDAAIALAADVARGRLAGALDETLALLGDAVRDSGATGRVAIDELCAELARGLAANQPEHVFEATRHLARGLRRGRGDIAGRTAGFTLLARVVAWARDRRSAELVLLRADLLELARDRVETGATPVAPEHMLTSLVRLPGKPTDDATEIAAALRFYGALLEGADAIDPDDLRRVARALGEPDDDVRAAAEDALTALGPTAAGELMATAAWGRRRARDRAAALLADLPVTPAALDRLIDHELDGLEETNAAIAVLDAPGDELLARRLDERLREIAYTVLLLVAARHRSPAIARAALAWSHARGGLERARTLAVIEAALPRALVSRLVDAVDDLTPSDRAAALARAEVELPARDAVIRGELAGRDRLARALALHILGASGRSAHRDTIAEAARAEVQQASPVDLIRRLTHAVHEPEPATDAGGDMPSRVETLIALGRVPLLAALTTRQLADVAERARWVHVRDGSVIVTSGDLLDAMMVLDDGELALGERRIVKGEVVDELACVAPVHVPNDLRATRASRLIRLERADFEELVDDVPGLAAAVCRALGERARRAETGSYSSPLASRG
ncbi:MAG TPA: cyclic nucleotide-binding domain-containing protein [Kofleriaceae bacterium]|nr:cyclic nucleotide-binding domain-containing protein [Kofleriaceae bacterium]